MMNPVKKIIGDKWSRNNKTIIPKKCAYCGDDLWFSGDTYDTSDENYVYHNGNYWCKWCFFNVTKKDRYEVLKRQR